MTELALERHPWEKNRSIALQHYVRENVLNKKYYEKIARFDRVMDILQFEDVSKFMAKEKNTPDYNTFFEKHAQNATVNGKTIGVIKTHVAITLGI